MFKNIILIFLFVFSVSSITAASPPPPPGDIYVSSLLPWPGITTQKIDPSFQIGNTGITLGGLVSGISTYTLPTASTSVIGGVKVDGTTITINSGVISSPQYTLPIASTSLGGVKVGSPGAGLFVTGIDSSGNLLYGAPMPGGTTYTLPAASTSLGGVKVGSPGTGLFVSGVDSSGTLLYGTPNGVATTSTISFGYVGKPVASQISQVVFTYPCTVPANFASTYGYINTQATGTVSIALRYIHNNTPTVIGNVTSSGNTPLMPTTSSISFVPGDILQMTAPSTQDATFADMIIGISCTRVLP